MRNTLKFLIAGAMIAGTAAAQEKSASVESVLKELSGYQGKAVDTTTSSETAAVAAPVVIAEPAPAVIEPAPAVTAEPAAKESRGWKFWKKSGKQEVAVAEQPEVVAPSEVATDKPAEQPVKAEIPEAAVAALDVPATVEASRELYAGGEFEAAQRGFEAVIKKDPENVVARMYLRKILERDPRTAEVRGMKAVSGAWKTALVLRSYDISAEAAAKMGLEKASESADVTAHFPEVDFPKGASAVYQPKTAKLFVRNTGENLAVLEEILAAMDVSKLSSGVDQVEIEAKFVEVSEGTLEALGFDWRHTGNDPINTGIYDNDVTIPAGEGLFNNARRGGVSQVLNPETLLIEDVPQNLPFNQRGALETSAGSGEWKAFRFEDTFNSNPDFMTVEHRGSTPLDVLISALDQSAGTDVLSAPRIVTRSGKKATIRVGEMHYFPAGYEVGGNEGNIIHVKYSDFDEKLLGVELDVNPKVDGDQISLSLNPRVSELLGWQGYQVVPANSSYSYYQFGINQQFNHSPVVARLPIFKRREIKTEVTIADGATMGMGGLINEKVEKYEDKVPVLGSIPLIGRLFRNEGERAVKRNLMIFVTAKKVEPSGRINTARSFE